MSISLSRSVNGASAFYLIVFGQLVSLLGSGLTSFGLSVWVFRESRSTLAYSVVLVFILLPVALGSFIAGPLVDRCDRRRILLLTDTTSALMTLALALLHSTNQLQLGHVYAALFVSGIALSFQIPAQQAIVPLLIQKEKLGRAAGLSQLPGTMSEIVAPLLAGALLVSVGLGGIFLIDFVTFLIGIFTIFLVNIPSPLPETSPTSAPGFREEFTAGFRYLWIQRPFLYLTGYITLMVFTLGAYYALYPPLILSMASDNVLGLVNALIGLGSLAGVVLLGIWKIDRRVRAILAAGLLMSLGGIVAGLRPNLFITRQLCFE
jgi:MFS family permease